MAELVAYSYLSPLFILLRMRKYCTRANRTMWPRDTNTQFQNDMYVRLHFCDFKRHKLSMSS